MQSKQLLTAIFGLLIGLAACARVETTPVPTQTTAPTSLPATQALPTAEKPTIPTTTPEPTPAIAWPVEEITVHNAARLQVLQSWGEGRAEEVFQRADSDFLVVFGNGTVSVYRQSTAEQLYEIAEVQTVAVSFSANTLVTTHPGTEGAATPIRLRNLDTGEVRGAAAYKIDRYSDWQFSSLQEARAAGLSDVAGISLSADGAILAAGFIDGALIIWDTSAEPLEITRQQYKNGPGFTTFSPSGNTLLVGIGHWWLYDDSLKGAWSLSQLNFYQFPEMKLLKSYGNASASDSSLSILPGFPTPGSILVANGLNILQVDLESGETQATIPVGRQIEQIWLAPNGQDLLIYVVDKSKGYPYHYSEMTLSGPAWEKTSEREVDFSSKNKTRFAQPPVTNLGHIPPLLGAGIVDENIVAWGKYGDLPFWWDSVNKSVRPVDLPANLPLDFHYQDQSLLTCETGLVTLHQRDGTTTSFQLENLSTCDRLRLNHQGDTLAVASGPDLWLTNLDNTQRRYLQDSDQPLNTLLFSPDDSIFAAGTIGNYEIAPQTYFWSGKAGAPINQTRYPEDPTQKPVNGQPVLERDATGILSIIISTDNTLAVTLTENIRLWDLQTGQQLGLIPYDIDAFVTAGALSPDHRLLILGDETGRLRFWNLDTLTEIQVRVESFAIAHQGSINSIIFTDTASALLTAGADGVINLWGIP